MAVGLGLLLAAAAADAAAASGPGLVLLGVVLREGGGSFAVIEDVAASRVGFYRVGSSVGGLQVTAIEADRVRLLAEGVPTMLRLGTSSVGPAASRPTPPSTVGPEPSRPAGSGLPVPTPPTAEPPPPLYAHPAPVSPAAPPPRPAVSLGTGGRADAALAAPAPGGVAAEVVLTGLHHDGARRRGTQFSSATLRDLLVEVAYQNLSGAPQQRIELYAPDGSLYQRTSGPAAAATQTRFPVGGTWITAHALLGSWTVKVFVDGQPTPAGSATFVLTP